MAAVLVMQAAQLLAQLLQVDQVVPQVQMVIIMLLAQPAGMV
jgi:hypothetical protein